MIQQLVSLFSLSLFVLTDNSFITKDFCSHCAWARAEHVYYLQVIVVINTYFTATIRTSFILSIVNNSKNVQKRNHDDLWIVWLFSCWSDNSINHCYKSHLAAAKHLNTKICHLQCHYMHNQNQDTYDIMWFGCHSNNAVSIHNLWELFTQHPVAINVPCRPSVMIHATIKLCNAIIKVCHNVRYWLWQFNDNSSIMLHTRSMLSSAPNYRSR